MKLIHKILLFCYILAVSVIVILEVLPGGVPKEVALILLTFIFTSTVLSLSFNYFYSRRVTDMIFKVEEMAAGNLDRVIRNTGRDELGQLANSLNELIGRLRTGIAIDVQKDKEMVRAKDDFVALASHQLRTPLSIVKWYIDFVLNGDAGELSKDQKNYLREVYLANERLIELVNNMLDVSRIDLGTFSIDPEPSDLVKLAEAAIKMSEKGIKAKKIFLEKKFDQIPVIELDPRLMKIVFQNLLSNAVKYTPESGFIKFEIKRGDSNVLIKVSDNGCGIPREQQPQIFSKLFRADNVRKIESLGTGLGLYIVRAVIEKSGGKIWFESPSLDLFLEKERTEPKQAEQWKDKGTTFFISIPLKGMKKKVGTKKLTSAEY